MLTSRPPIIVILGHVDHGKTTLLDYLRRSNIAAREAGGITQSTRSFKIPYQNTLLTFIDTPGHAAFVGMRDRGSKVADLAVLVVAANEGVMPQTKESIAFIKTAGIPFVVALTKSDLSASDPDRVKTQLAQNDVVVEDFGGDVPAVSLSAKTGAGVPDLLEVIYLLASLSSFRADPEGPLEMVVLESRLDPQKGPVAFCIVRNGTLTPGLTVFDSAEIGKIRAIFSTEGQPIKSALPSTPVEILGLTSVPAVGSTLTSMPGSQKDDQPQKFVAKASGQNPKTVNLIIKADTLGSLEAIKASLSSEFNLVSSGTGEVTESDVSQAVATKAKIISFNAKTSSNVAKLAEIEKVSIHHFKIIYELLEAVDKFLSPAVIEKILGRAIVLAEFKINTERVAGCKCVEGAISKTAKIKVVRGEEVVGISGIKSLKIGKNEVSTVKSGSEFGMAMTPQLDFKISDSIISFETHEQA